MSNVNLSFWDHLDDLRQTLLSILAVIVIGVMISFYFYQNVFHLLTIPLQKSENVFLKQDLKREKIFNISPLEKEFVLLNDSRVVFYSLGSREIHAGKVLIPPQGYIEIEKSSPQNTLVVLDPLEGMAASLKVSFWMGLVATSPLWLVFLLKFIMPGLYREERRLIPAFLAASLLFLSTGFFFAFFVILPVANGYLKQFNESIAYNLWSLSHYLDYTISLLLAHAFAFEMAVIFAFLVHFGVFTADRLSSKRRHAIVAAFILGAFFTPPDIFTQFLLAIPMVVLYELVIVYAKLREKMCSLPCRQEA